MNRQRRRALERHIEHLARLLRTLAWRGVTDGRDATFPYVRACTVDDLETGARIIFTRDIGHHTSGWMRNPDYEQCLHLSLSPIGGRIVVPGVSIPDLDRPLVKMLVDGFFPGENKRCIWYESPKSPEGISRQVQHWRVFCDATWSPIIPRGEVYDSELTEIGWKSASQLFEEEGRIVQSVLDPT